MTSLHATPGNPGIAEVATLENSSNYVELATHLHADLTVVGPEAPLVDGIVDQFRARRMPIVGPVAENARLEGSKIHTKKLLRRLGIPTARFETAESLAEARAALRLFRYPVVLKTDGLAAGKGVIIAHNSLEADDAIATLPFPLLMEEFLEGDEVSFIALCDGRNAVALEPSQDHKRVFDNDQGPNTGGMGAYSDSRILSPAQRDAILETIVNPVVRATAFTGFLYAGLMMTTYGPSVLEFNVRMGDPETQALMLRLESDWGEALMAAARGNLTQSHLTWSPEPATCIVLASAGYPGPCISGLPVTGIENAKGAQVFHAGTRREGHTLLTSGGRVLGVTARGADLQTSINNAYAAVSTIHFEGMQFRTDIGQRGLRSYYNRNGAGT